MTDDRQLSMIDDLKIDDKWREEWKNMPEYRMTQEVPLRTIKISFKTKEDIQKFSELIGQKIYENRENYWYPKLNVSLYSNLVYVDSEDES